MTFGIITHAIHNEQKGEIFAYEPFVREMNLWAKYVEHIIILAPSSSKRPSKIEIAYKHPHIKVIEIPNFDITSFKNALKAIFVIPKIVFSIFKVMNRVDHIHLRCPGNIGLLACFVQMFFPAKPKTAKYAGNWDPKAKQPITYKLQRWLLSNTFLTKNMQVLVYGDWPNQSENIKPFFTASFSESEVKNVKPKEFSGPLNMVFLGSLVEGKQPLEAVKIAEALSQKGLEIHLDLYGDGPQRALLQQYIIEHKLESIVSLKGNQPKEVIKQALNEAHFSILPSKSEGWPKAIAEAMFFGVIPIATPVSCVPHMLDAGKRGFLLTNDFTADFNKLYALLHDKTTLNKMSKAAATWSQQYTLERFEAEITKLLQ
ncbi:glycosyltransferase family 4 protein [Pseudotamlana carrageenivorans]|uniref:Glycosyl transferase n=1 Tax=Pseudotamlana carrageenivorans TaxID=2069432 RepID=A0A2I7SDZ9_9FLAO|nr:glycosyltransferase [Tamlana carrageenivorans]AUS04116.1 glycosyl transferase [Tamlana carrageenivorans]